MIWADAKLLVDKKNIVQCKTHRDTLVTLNKHFLCSRFLNVYTKVFVHVYYGVLKRLNFGPQTRHTRPVKRMNKFSQSDRVYEFSSP